MPFNARLGGLGGHAADVAVGVVFVTGDDEVVKDADVKQFGGIDNSFGQIVVFATGAEVTRRMIMDKYHSYARVDKGVAHYHSKVNYRGR